LPRPTYLPLFIALATAAAVLAMLFKFYWVSLAMALLTAGLFVFSGQSAGLSRDYGPLPVGRGLNLPPHTEVAGAPAWWALIFTLVADGTLFTSLIFGALYLWISAPNWPSAVASESNVLVASASIVTLFVGGVGARGSLGSLASGHTPYGWIALTTVSLLVAIAALVTMIGHIVPHPREHALGATSAALLGYVALHAAIGLLFLLSNLMRITTGFVSRRRLTDLRLTGLWIDYTAVTGMIAVGLVLALPALVGVLGVRP
jgi:cytochrome c oxidase subunit I+III